MRCNYCGKEYSKGFIKTHRRYCCPENPDNKYIVRLRRSEAINLYEVLWSCKRGTLRNLKRTLRELIKIAAEEGSEKPKRRRVVLAGIDGPPRIDRKTWKPLVEEDLSGGKQAEATPHVSQPTLLPSHSTRINHTLKQDILRGILILAMSILALILLWSR